MPVQCTGVNWCHEHEPEAASLVPNKPRPENPNRIVRVTDEEWEPVVEIAAKDKVTKSEVVREAIRQYVGRRKKENE